MEDSERLTTRNESGGISVADIHAALAKLAELEDTEQEGRLVVLPCKVGDTVYLVDGTLDIFDVVIGTVTKITYHEPCKYPNLSAVTIKAESSSLTGNCREEFIDMSYSGFGDIAFFDIAEAKVALERQISRYWGDDG